MTKFKINIKSSLNFIYFENSWELFFFNQMGFLKWVTGFSKFWLPKIFSSLSRWNEIREIRITTLLFCNNLLVTKCVLEIKLILQYIKDFFVIIFIFMGDIALYIAISIRVIGNMMFKTKFMNYTLINKTGNFCLFYLSLSIRKHNY